jgi:hypothetical protein
MEVELKGFLLFLFYRGRSVSRIRFMTLIVFSLDGFQSWWFFFFSIGLGVCAVSNEVLVLLHS